MRVLQGYIDIAGQASRYSKVLNDMGVHSEAWVYERVIDDEPVNRILNFTNSGFWNGRIRKAKYTIEVLSKFDILHIHKGFSILHDSMDLKLAKKFNKKIFIHYRGSEIRQEMKADQLSKKVIDKIKKEEDLSNIILVKDGQIAELIKPYVSNFEIFPNIVNVESVKHIEKKYNVNKKLKVVHIPSNPKFKGTDIIRNELAKLKNAIDYVELTNISHYEVLNHFISADLVIDQLLTGTYGNASLEAMALGTTVLNYLNPKFTKYEPESPPIINIEKYNICDTILYLNSNREIIERNGILSRNFTDSNHSNEVVGKKLIELYKRFS